MTKKPKESGYSNDPSHPLYDPKRDPTHQSYEEETAKGAPNAEPSEDGYKVGPGFPPNKHKWKKGCPSPNSRGRPKRVLSMKPDLKKALESALNEKVVITKDKKEMVFTKAALGIQQLVNQFAKGDRHARRDLFQYAALLGVCMPRISSRRRWESTRRRSSNSMCNAGCSSPRRFRRKIMSRRRLT